MRSGISTKPGLLRRFAAAKWFRTSDGAMAATLAAEPQAFPELASLGQMFPDYRRIFHFPGEFIDAGHRAIAGARWPDRYLGARLSAPCRCPGALRTGLFCRRRHSRNRIVPGIVHNLPVPRRLQCRTWSAGVVDRIGS